MDVSTALRNRAAAIREEMSLIPAYLTSDAVGAATLMLASEYDKLADEIDGVSPQSGSPDQPA